MSTRENERWSRRWGRLGIEELPTVAEVFSIQDWEDPHWDQPLTRAAMTVIAAEVLGLDVEFAYLKEPGGIVGWVACVEGDDEWLFPEPEPTVTDAALAVMERAKLG